MGGEDRGQPAGGAGPVTAAAAARTPMPAPEQAQSRLQGEASRAPAPRTNRRRDGKISWDYTTKMPLLDTRGEVIGICGINKDSRR